MAIGTESAGLRSRERISRLRDGMLRTPELCVERGYLMTESYRETESESPVIRRARALEKVLAEMTISIEDGELIVGRTTSKRRGGPLLPEVNSDWYSRELDSISTREWDRFAPVSEEEKSKVRELVPYWKGKSLYDRFRAIVPGDALKLNFKIQAPVGAYSSNCMHLAHTAVDYERVVNLGLDDVRKEVEAELGKLDLTRFKDFKKYQLLKAINITLEAAVGFAGRYAGIARRMAGEEKDAQRRAELETVADICARVPAGPARSFYEALQSVWLTYIVLMNEGWGPGMSFGRLDQYLYPFYRRDIEEGRMAREEARELIALLYIKLNESVTPFSDEVVRDNPGFAMLSNITLGGVSSDGKDAVNELSYLFLDAEEDVRLHSEDLVIRVNRNNPDAFLMKACEVARGLRGKLKFSSDDTSIQQLLGDGKPLEYARDYIVTGCNTPTVPARSLDLPGAVVNLPLMLELALNNGVSRLKGEQIGPRTGDPRKFRSYDDVWKAYKQQVETLLPVIMLLKNADRQLFADYAPCPFQSALTHGCIEKGLDIVEGGTAPYIAQPVSGGGAPNVGDSLAAIKKAVFEDGKITMAKLIDALDRNFEGEEEVLHVLKAAPKFGNDDDYVDTIVSDVLAHLGREAARYEAFAGARSNLAAMAVTTNVPLGRIVGALPDGRKAGEPLSEGGISPYQGRNVSGPTATMRSVARIDHAKISGGSVLNMRFDPDTLKDGSKMKKFASLIRTFCETGGHIVQFNIVSTDTLREAQKKPEKYRDLLVRVATYSAYFVELSPELQNDIIARTEFQEV